MENGQFAGLSAAWQAFERSRNRESHEAVRLRLRLSLLPYDVTEFPELEGAEFGMQDLKGTLIRPEERDDGRSMFEVGVVARRNRTNGTVSILGPYAHGPAGDEFLYLNWRVPGRSTQWIWRRKFRLTSLDWGEIVTADANGEVFSFDGTGRTGHNTARINWQREPR